MKHLTLALCLLASPALVHPNWTFLCWFGTDPFLGLS